jgi:GAF domain-containing protein
VAEELLIEISAGREDKYRTLFPQIEALLTDETNLIANMANIAAALKQTFGFFWVGFYLVDGDTMVLGPFQGPIACTRIARGKGVCGKVWMRRETEIVPNVDEFPGHIACSSESKSEIVVPGMNDQGEVLFVLDIDSDKLEDFGEVDKLNLERLIQLISK